MQCAASLKRGSAAVAMIDDHNPRMAQAVQDRRSLEKQRASQTAEFQFVHGIHPCASFVRECIKQIACVVRAASNRKRWLAVTGNIGF